MGSTRTHGYLFRLDYESVQPQPKLPSSVRQTYVRTQAAVQSPALAHQTTAGAKKNPKKQVEAETTVYTNTAGHTYSTQQLAPHRVPVHKAPNFCSGCYFFVPKGEF